MGDGGGLALAVDDSDSEDRLAGGAAEGDTEELGNGGDEDDGEECVVEGQRVGLVAVFLVEAEEQEDEDIGWEHED